MKKSKGKNEMKYGYIRVSSKSQQDNTSLILQRQEVVAAGAEVVVEEVFTGGTIKDRPQFSNLIQELKSGDELIVTKLDRFARTVSEGSALAEELYARGVTLNILNMGKIEHSTVGTLLLNVMLCFAQFEKDMINQRCKDGKAVAKQNPDFREGRPRKYAKAQLELALTLLDSGKTYREVEAMTGISKSTVIREKRKRLLTPSNDTA